MSRKLRKSLMAVLGVAALTGVSTQASAIGSVFDMGTVGPTPVGRSELTGSVYGWDGQNNGKLGWTHSSEWSMFTVASTMSIEVKVAATPVAGNQQNILLPGFTIWATTPEGFVAGNHDPNYSYTGYQFNTLPPPGMKTTHPFNVVKGAPTNLSGQQSTDWACDAGGCTSNNWLAPGGGDGSFGKPGFPATHDGITTIVGYANAGNSFTNGNGDLVGSGAVGSDNNGPLTGLVTVQGPKWSAQDGGPSNTDQFADLILYNLSPGIYFMNSGGSCNNLTICALQVSQKSTFYSITVSQIATPVPLPATVWLFASALAGLGVFGGRKGNQFA